MSADFWTNTAHQAQCAETGSGAHLEALLEFWSLVKTIYQQSPLLYNSFMSISNLVDFMKRVAETFESCCEHHKHQQNLLYGDTQNGTDGGDESAPKLEVDKFLEPICGVLEIVLTSGGKEILAEIDHISRSLCLTASPCFHLHLLKLLKVLLLDSRQTNQSLSLEYSQQFLANKGLQVLLYLCSNSALLDIKAMCIKLIDVLSEQTQMVAMRIDTELIAYLEHVLVPKSLKHKQCIVGH